MTTQKTKRVRALETGFDNLSIREPGDEFDMPADAKAPWFEDVEDAKPAGKGGKKDDALA